MASSSRSSSPISASSSASTSSTSNKKQLKRKRVVQDEHDTDDGISSGSEKEDAEGEEDAEVLSHAAQRKEKKRQRLLEKQSSTKTTAAGTGDKADKTQARRQNSVWVGNMSFKTTPETLKTFFKDAGEVTRVHMPTKTAANRGSGMRGENMGFAYVDFASPDAKAKAITMSEGHLDGRRLLIKDGGDFTGRPNQQGASSATAKGAPGTGTSKTAQKILRSQKQPPAPTLFLGNLGFETTDQSIKDMLTAHASSKRTGKDENEGEKTSGNAETKDDQAPKRQSKSGNGAGIRKVRMGTFEDSGLCKGFAFVDFHNTEQATAVLINPRNHHLDGRKLVVEYASAEAVRRGAGRAAAGLAHKDAAKNGDERGGRPFRSKQSVPASPRMQEEESGPVGEEVAEEPPTRDFEHSARRDSTFSKRPTPYQSRKRAKPGAALAQAQREKVAIVPSQGQRLKFT